MRCAGVLDDSSPVYRLLIYSATTESKDQYGASSTPIYQTATFKGLNGEYDYTRSGNPTRTALGKSLAFQVRQFSVTS
jgi:cystathionine beta-lyase/cystathionine gamma-synthase